MGGSAGWRSRTVWTHDENGRKVPLRDADGKIVKVAVGRQVGKNAQANARQRGAQRMAAKRKQEIENLLKGKDYNLISQLEQSGFKRWTKNGKDRLYINASTLGADRSLYGTKTYIDLTDGTVHSEDGTLQKEAERLLHSKYSEMLQSQKQASKSQTNTVYNKFMAMTDDEKASAIIKYSGTKGDITRLPTPLQKGGESRVQKVVHDLGMHDKPMVLDTKEFNKFMKDHGLTSRDLMTRSANNQNTLDAFRTSDYNYVAGRVGGSAFGEGTYFDHTGGRNTGYGTWSMNAVLNPQTAKVVKYSQLKKIKQSFSPALQKAVGNNETLIALAAGYNVIDVGTGYTVVIDRSAVVAENRTF
ncbi:MAG: hypothetical protein J6W04_04285 [Bacteroidales bacterium]|nr:hypothetical protein [Bacteroidales bacterium]